MKRTLSIILLLTLLACQYAPADAQGETIEYTTLAQDTYRHIGRFVDGGVVCYVYAISGAAGALSCVPLASIPDASEYY